MEDLARVEAAALEGCSTSTRLEVVIEPTGPAWLPVAVFFTGRGHRVHRVSSAKAADLRRFLSRHAKSNGIDAETLARLPLVDPQGLRVLELPGAQAAALDRRVRATDRLTRAAARHKVRIKDLVRQLMPATPLSGDLGVADLAVLERWADPDLLLAAGSARVTARIAQASHGHQGAERAAQWRAAARAAVELYASWPAMPFSDLAAEVASEVRLLRGSRPRSTSTPRTVRTPTGRPIPASSPAACPGCPPSAPRRWSPRSVIRTGFPRPATSARSPG